MCFKSSTRDSAKSSNILNFTGNTIMMKEKSSYKFRLVKIVLSIQEFKTYHVFINVISHVFSLISSPCVGALTLRVNISNPEGILDP